MMQTNVTSAITALRPKSEMWGFEVAEIAPAGGGIPSVPLDQSRYQFGHHGMVRQALRTKNPGFVERSRLHTALHKTLRDAPRATPRNRHELLPRLKNLQGPQVLRAPAHFDNSSAERSAYDGKSQNSRLTGLIKRNTVLVITE